MYIYVYVWRAYTCLPTEGVLGQTQTQTHYIYIYIYIYISLPPYRPTEGVLGLGEVHGLAQLLHRGRQVLRDALATCVVGCV